MGGLPTAMLKASYYSDFKGYAIDKEKGPPERILKDDD